MSMVVVRKKNFRDTNPTWYWSRIERVRIWWIWLAHRRSDQKWHERVAQKRVEATARELVGVTAQRRAGQTVLNVDLAKILCHWRTSLSQTLMSRATYHSIYVHNIMSSWRAISISHTKFYQPCSKLSHRRRTYRRWGSHGKSRKNWNWWSRDAPFYGKKHKSEIVHWGIALLKSSHINNNQRTPHISATPPSL